MPGALLLVDLLGVLEEEVVESERKCREYVVRLAAAPPSQVSGPVGVPGAGIGSLRDAHPTKKDNRLRPCYNHGRSKLVMHQALSRPDECQCCRRQCT